MTNRDHEIGFENLDWDQWHMLTGLPREAYDEWLTHDPETRRDIVGIFQDPDECEAIREARDGE